MGIKEIAPKLTQKLSIAINDDEAVEFAEALIAELAKQNEPVARVNGYYSGHPVIMPLVKYVFPVGLALYTFPLTAEQIANETAWQPIETAPKDEAVFLAWRKHATHPLMVRYEPSYDWFANYDGEHVYDLTHWMPLPTPPKRSVEGV